MASIKDFNRKIASLKNTRKITRTMKMVSASKLRRAQNAQRGAQLFARETNLLIHRLAGGISGDMHPLLAERAPTRRVLLVIFSSDRGLCGGFNNNLIRFAEARMRELEAEGLEVRAACCGRRAHQYFKDRGKVDHFFEGVTVRPDARDARLMSERFCADFVAGRYDRVFIVNNLFHSPISQRPAMTPLLPLRAADLDAGESAALAGDFIVEPAARELAAHLVPRIVDFKLFFALLENCAGEHGARMNAMDNATTNAGQLIDSYTLRRNRARQAAITTELTEIISGAEAL